MSRRDWSRKLVLRVSLPDCCLLRISFDLRFCQRAQAAAPPCSDLARLFCDCSRNASNMKVKRTAVSSILDAWLDATATTSSVEHGVRLRRAIAHARLLRQESLPSAVRIPGKFKDKSLSNISRTSQIHVRREKKLRSMSKRGDCLLHSTRKELSKTVDHRTAVSRLEECGRTNGSETFLFGRVRRFIIER